MAPEAAAVAKVFDSKAAAVVSPNTNASAPAPESAEISMCRPCSPRFFDDMEPLGSAVPTTTAVPPPDAKLVATAITTGMTEPLQRLTSLVEPWAAPDYEKAAWPYRVQREYDRLLPEATRQIDRNQHAVQRDLGSRVVVLDLLKDSLTAANFTFTEALNESHPLCEVLRNTLLTAANQRSVFSYDGTLFVMGWGNGDHAAPSADVPCGPKTAAKALLRSVEPGIEAEVAKALASGVVAPKV